ncbi:manganese efflux pump [Bacillus sp. BGMRC 2118]|nr:manganese efflux pump [Bacillus sp. BGMRC 2118]
MDAFAVSITSGVALKNNFKLKSVLKVVIFLTFFQAAMPLLGWIFGIEFSLYIKNVDHWIAFVLLVGIGSKMIYDSLSKSKDDAFNPLDNKVLFFLSLATSIDALAVGVSFAFLDISILFSVVIIASITFILVVLGTIIGKVSGERLKKKAEIFGGIVLGVIGCKILIEHLNLF